MGGGLVRRRRWSEAQKRQIVAETHEPGVSVPMVAQRYNLNANQILSWRGLSRETERAVPGLAGSCRWWSRLHQVRGGHGDDEPSIGECRRGGPAGDGADGDRAGGRSPEISSSAGTLMWKDEAAMEKFTVEGPCAHDALRPVRPACQSERIAAAHLLFAFTAEPVNGFGSQSAFNSDFGSCGEVECSSCR